MPAPRFNYQTDREYLASCERFRIEPCQADYDDWYRECCCDADDDMDDDWDEDGA